MSRHSCKLNVQSFFIYLDHYKSIMKKKLFTAVFEKGKLQSGKETKHGLSNFLSNAINEKLNFSINSVTLARYYEKYLEGNKANTYNPSTEILDAISAYLGFDNFEDFVVRNREHDDDKKKTNKRDTFALNSIRLFLDKYKKFLIIFLLVLVAIFVIVSVNRHRWMLWDEDEYIEVKFDAEKLSSGELKVFKKERIEFFKMVKPDCDFKFFGEDGSERLWYGKNKEGQLEFFSALGRHPTTGKTLKAITPYMIRKYICKTY